MVDWNFHVKKKETILCLFTRNVHIKTVQSDSRHIYLGLKVSLNTERYNAKETYNTGLCMFHFISIGSEQAECGQQFLTTFTPFSVLSTPTFMYGFSTNSFQSCL